jgi:hypothetical protein
LFPTTPRNNSKLKFLCTVLARVLSQEETCPQGSTRSHASTTSLTFSQRRTTGHAAAASKRNGVFKVTFLILQLRTTLTLQEKHAGTTANGTRAVAVPVAAEGRSKEPPKAFNYRMVLSPANRKTIIQVAAGKEVPADASSVEFVVPASCSIYLDLPEAARLNETEEEDDD